MEVVTARWIRPGQNMDPFPMFLYICCLPRYGPFELNSIVSIFNLPVKKGKRFYVHSGK